MSRTSTLPKRLQPMLATLTDAPFDDPGWVFEDKYDGFRMIAPKLVKLTAPKSPFPAKVKDEATTTWVKPVLVAEVKFAEWTANCGSPSTSGSGPTSGSAGAR